MPRHAWSLVLVLASLAGLTSVVPASAGASGEEPRIVPIAWPHPVYPQIAQSARVQGDVEVAVDVRPDGSVAAADVVRGVPLLNQAAVDAARRARFECRHCVGALNRYSLYVTFRLSLQDPPVDPAPLVVSPSQGWVTVTAPVPFVNGGPGPMDGDGRERGIKCLFLWRCDPPAQRARDGHCLWLWRCGGLYTYR
jgi:TonB family protein